MTIPVRPPKPAPGPGVARVVFEGAFSGQPIVNVMHVLSGNEAWTQAQAQTLATAARNAFKNTFLPILANGYILGNVTVQDIGVNTGVFATAGGSDNGGDISSGNAPLQLAACMSWKTPRHYRGGHPRTYFGGFKDSVMADPGHFTSTFTNAMNAAAATFITDINAAVPTGAVNTPGLSLVLTRWNKLGNAWFPVEIWPITAGVMNARIDTQRRRLPAV